MKRVYEIHKVVRLGLLWVTVAMMAFPAVVQAHFILATNEDTITIIGYSGSDDNLTIPDTINGLPVTGIGYQAFQWCNSLTNVTIGTNVTIIGDNAFFFCSNLIGVTIPASVISIGVEVFWLCSSLNHISVDESNPVYRSLNGALLDKSQGTLIQYPGGIAGNYSIPDNVTNIGYGAFSYGVLSSVTFPDNVINIGEHAFYWCKSLTNVMIGNGVTNIGGEAFEGCANLASVTIGANVTKIGYEAFYSCSNLTSVTMGNSVTDIGSWAFYHCTKLTNITFPDSLTSIGKDAFSNCHSLNRVMIPDNVTNIGVGAFVSCSSLTNVTIPNGVVSIKGGISGGGTFAHCTALTRVVIGSGVTNIEYQGFYACPSLSRVYFLGNAPSLGSDVFTGDNNATIFYLPETLNWESSLGDRPTMLWNPQVKANDNNFGVGENGFGFTITGTTNLVIMVEACTNLADPVWFPLGTNTITNGASSFSDPEWASYPERFYRFRAW